MSHFKMKQMFSDKVEKARQQLNPTDAGDKSTELQKSLQTVETNFREPLIDDDNSTAVI